MKTQHPSLQHILLLSLLLCSTLVADTHYYGHQVERPLVTTQQDATTLQVQLPGLVLHIKPNQTDSSIAIQNHLGSYQMILSNSAVKNVCSYTPYGYSTSTDGDLSDDCLYLGTYRPISGAGLLISPIRVYDPLSKRFLAQDPHRQLASVYGYGADPVNWHDESGGMLRRVVGNPVEQPESLPTESAIAQQTSAESVLSGASAAAGVSLPELSASAKPSGATADPFYRPDLYDRLNQINGQRESESKLALENTKRFKETHMLTTYPDEDTYEEIFTLHTEITQNEITFYERFREPHAPMFMTDAVRAQYLKMAQENHFEGRVPKRFRINNLANRLARLVMAKHESGTPEFLHAFLQTDNGRSSLRVANEFGLNIDSVHTEGNQNIRMELSPKTDPSPLQVRLPQREINPISEEELQPLSDAVDFF